MTVRFVCVALATVAVGLVKGLSLPIAFGQDLPGNAYLLAAAEKPSVLGLIDVQKTQPAGVERQGSEVNFSCIFFFA